MKLSWKVEREARRKTKSSTVGRVRSFRFQDLDQCTKHRFRDPLFLLLASRLEQPLPLSQPDGVRQP